MRDLPLVLRALKLINKMSNLCAIIEFIQKLCLENGEINTMLKEIDEINQQNSKLENQLEEFDREHVRLQIELYNLETIISHNGISPMETFQQTYIKMFKDSIELRNLVEKIDFTKILQCYHMEMEAKYAKQWQPIQNCFVKTINWYEQMEQRYIVQKYRQAEILLREAEEANRNQEETMEKSFKQSLELIKLALEKRNEMIVVLTKANKDVHDFKAKMKTLNEYQVYIEGLRREKLKIGNNLEKVHLKAFNPILSLNTNPNLTKRLNPNTEACNLIMPKLPSFTEILKSFNQTENITNITAIENTTKFCVKSILHTSSCKQSITTKQTKNVRFNVQLEEYQEEMTQNIYNCEMESETDVEIEISPTQTAMEINECKEEKESLPKMEDIEHNSEIEIVDLLTPANDLAGTVKENQEAMDSSDYESNIQNQIDKKPLIEIQDCKIFKTPFPIHEISNIQDIIKGSCSEQSTDAHSNSFHSDIKKILSTTKKSFSEDFLNVSSSAEASPNMLIQSDSKKTSTLQELETFCTDFFFASKESNEGIKANETLNKFETNKTIPSEVQDFLDFGSNKGFAFDSDDNMADNYNAGNMDFM